MARQQKTRKVKSRPPTPYPRPLINASAAFMNVSETWTDGKGRRNTVVIRDGQGMKRVENLGPNGRVMGQQTRRLTGAERAKILRGKFVPGLWRNCRLGSCN